jgi:hypothetical protein
MARHALLIQERVDIQDACSRVDHGCSRDPHRIDVSAGQQGPRDRHPERAAPNRPARRGIKAIERVGFGRHDHQAMGRPSRPPVERLRHDLTVYRPVE